MLEAARRVLTREQAVLEIDTCLADQIVFAQHVVVHDDKREDRVAREDGIELDAPEFNNLFIDVKMKKININDELCHPSDFTPLSSAI